MAGVLNMSNKVYLDFQIIDNCSKDEKYRKHFLGNSENEYYLSVNHFEELHRAFLNCKKQFDNPMKLYRTIEKFYNYKKVILNPSIDQGVDFKNEQLIDIVRYVIEYDTVDIIYDCAKILKNVQREKVIINDNDESWKTIWKQDKVIELIDMNSRNKIELNDKIIAWLSTIYPLSYDYIKKLIKIINVKFILICIKKN